MIRSCRSSDSVGRAAWPRHLAGLLIRIGLLLPLATAEPPRVTASPKHARQLRPVAQSQPTVGKEGKEQEKRKATQGDSGVGRQRSSQIPPWARRRGPRPELPVKPFQHARELLKQYDIDASALGYLHDRQPISADDEDTIIRVLLHVPQFRLDDVQRWTKKQVSWEQLIAEPQRHRADYYHLRGHATRVQRVELLDELADLLDYSHYYRVALQVDDAPHPILICARQVPRHWPIDQAMHEPAAADAMFMKVGANANENLQPVNENLQLIFAGRRIRWFPDRSDGQLTVPPDHVRLAGLGMDVGLFDQLQGQDGLPLGGPERECFYRLMASLQEPRAARRLGKASRPINLTQLLLEPTRHHGRFVSLQATLRRITPVKVGDEDINATFGLRQYYQLDTFVSLGDKAVRLGSKDNPHAPVFRRQFPVTICVVDLPDELRQLADEQRTAGDRNRLLNEEIKVQAVFFKIWSYHTQFVENLPNANRQVSPMLLAYSIELESDESRGPLTGWTVGLVFVAALAGICFFIWWNSRKDEDKLKQLRSQTLGQATFHESE